jgi:hypothetical protein
LEFQLLPDRLEEAEMSIFSLAVKTARTMGLLVLSPITMPVVGELARPAVKAVIKAGLVVCSEGKKLVDEAKWELEKEGPALLSIGGRVTEEVAKDLVESLVEEGAETGVESAVGEILEEVAAVAVEALI